MLPDGTKPGAFGGANLTGGGVKPTIESNNKDANDLAPSVLAAVAKLKFDTVVPGHSAPNATTMTRAEFDAYKQKVDTLASRFAELVLCPTNN